MSEYLDAMKEQYKELQQAAWNTEQQIVKLEIENKNLREALKQARWQLRNQGYTMRQIALGMGITPTQLSAWTDEIPDREPDFKD